MTGFAQIAAIWSGCHGAKLEFIAGDNLITHSDIAQIGKGRSVYKLDCDTLERIKIADVPTPEPLSPSWVHDFPFTENYIIIPDTPLKFNILVRFLACTNGI